MAFMNPRGLLTPGKPTPVRKVPDHIERPEYAWKDDVQENVGEPVIQTPETIEAMREASKIAANALALAGAAVAPGKTTDEIDGIVHDYLIGHGAYPSTLGYRGFTKSSCVSLNEIVCHGIPDTTVIQEGDIVNIDVTAYKNGVHGDTNATFFAGEVAQEHKDLVNRTYQAMMRGIKAAKPGREINVIGRVIEAYAKRFGYNVVTDFTGHGVGTTFHNGLVVLHYDSDAYTDVLEPGMTLTVEPMINLGELPYTVWDDGWTVQNVDGEYTAQFEHTIVITDDGNEILTIPDADVAAGQHMLGE
ncbi:type I methionyl aminopeptidase [Corynebacterium coyleae]|nr:type I methionyl aminopeptidase [Corynebacterium coyleae]MDK8662851.1 type I methionyl aminopeptidase [Corynebacterium coyleae]MDK8706103.1 type I methionyl aminopeptidase [Corynebacterium coyleae]MDK8732810.1 type I methionyl aminopeptidase [Corynebacterium coyleae]MDK8798581.1 type I methionyl aminopeptidase [Corynebacterium coyleae]MDK8892144.1 type I methionyl aminopeptidase [Corynebacterium coyleae]